MAEPADASSPEGHFQELRVGELSEPQAILCWKLSQRTILPMRVDSGGERKTSPTASNMGGVHFCVYLGETIRADA